MFGYGLEEVQGEAPVASYSELLDFCNTVRNAGGGQVLHSLLPATPQDSKACLVAKNLNFDCQVYPIANPDGSDYPIKKYSDGKLPYTKTWGMVIATVKNSGGGLFGDRVEAQTDEQLQTSLRIAETIGSELVLTRRYDTVRVAIKLPENIGNAAHAFDLRQAFTDLVI